MKPEDMIEESGFLISFDRLILIDFFLIIMLLFLQAPMYIGNKFGITSNSNHEN